MKSGYINSEGVYTEVDLTAEEEATYLAELEQDAQAILDALSYADKRASAYPGIQEQLDMQYWDSVNGTTTWADAIAQVKADYPKGAE